mmetsp:Transcript_14288/g.38513  ORF Transcript_14288/g.38513 Transcript_14288/m.38513 type:complete len:248 (+) Transcript_14288:103-846(+)
MSPSSTTTANQEPVDVDPALAPLTAVSAAECLPADDASPKAMATLPAVQRESSVATDPAAPLLPAPAEHMEDLTPRTDARDDAQVMATGAVRTPEEDETLQRPAKRSRVPDVSTERVPTASASGADTEGANDQTPVANADAQGLHEDNEWAKVPIGDHELSAFWNASAVGMTMGSMPAVAAAAASAFDPSFMIPPVPDVRTLMQYAFMQQFAQAMHTDTKPAVEDMLPEQQMLAVAKARAASRALAQ